MTSMADLLRQLGVNLGYVPHGEDAARPSTSRPAVPGQSLPQAANPFTMPEPLAQQSGAMPTGVAGGPRMASGQQVALPLPAGPGEMSRATRETLNTGAGNGFISARTPTMGEHLEDFIAGDTGQGPRRNFAKGITGLVEMSPAGALLAAGDMYNAQKEGRTGDAAWNALAAVPLPGMRGIAKEMPEAARGAARSVNKRARIGGNMPPPEYRMEGVTPGPNTSPAPGTKPARVPEADPNLFDYSALGEVPDVPQFDLPRNTPARGVPQRVQDITNDRGVRDKMLETIQSGRDMGGANWYNAEPLRLRFVEQLGQDAGNAAFRQYMDFVAATSPRSDVGTNVRNASYYYQRGMSGQGMPAVGDKNPAPYGHLAQKNHQINANAVAGEGWDPLKNPKPASFVENLVGNQQPATVDTHAFRLPALLGQDPRFLETSFKAKKDDIPQNIQRMVANGEISLADALQRPAWWQSQPKANEYAAMERYYQGLGQELGLTPAQTQASAWVGGGKITGLASDESKPFLRFFEDRVNLTAQKKGMDPRDVLNKFIRGEMPLLSIGAGGAVAAGASRERDR